MRHKPKYNSFRLIHEDSDGNETMIYCDNVTSSKIIETTFGAPIKGSGSRFITDSDVDIKIDDVIYIGETKVRVVAVPDIKLSPDSNNSRRGCYERQDKIFETS